MAAFVAITTLTFALLSYKARGLRFVAAGAVGAMLPLAIFVLEVVVFYGWDDLVHEVTVARTWILSFGAGADSIRFLYEAGHGPILLLWTVASDTHNITVFVMVVAGIVSSFFALSRGWLSEPHRFLSNLTVSATIGTIVASSMLYASFVDGFVNSTLPLASFLIAPALGALALELQTLLGKVWRSPHVMTLTTALVVVPVLLATIVHYEPPVEFQLYRQVQNELRQRPGVGPGTQSFFDLPGRLLAQQP